MAGAVWLNAAGMAERFMVEHGWVCMAEWRPAAAPDAATGFIGLGFIYRFYI